MRMFLLMLTSLSVQSRFNFNTESLVTVVESGIEKCFNHHLLAGQTMVVRYHVLERIINDEVIESKTSIIFRVEHPDSSREIKHFVKADGIMLVNHGLYMICFDNKLSMAITEFVYFEVSVEEELVTGGEVRKGHQRVEMKSCKQPFISRYTTGPGSDLPHYVHERSQIVVPNCIGDGTPESNLKQYYWFKDTFEQAVAKDRAEVWKCDDEDLTVLYRKYSDLLKNTSDLDDKSINDNIAKISEGAKYLREVEKSVSIEPVEQTLERSIDKEVPNNLKDEKIPDKSEDEELPDKSKVEEFPEKSKYDEIRHKSKDEEFPDKSKHDQVPDKSKGEELLAICIVLCIVCIVRLFYHLSQQTQKQELKEETKKKDVKKWKNSSRPQVVTETPSIRFQKPEVSTLNPGAKKANMMDSSFKNISTKIKKTATALTTKKDSLICCKMFKGRRHN